MTNCLDITVEMFCDKYPRPGLYDEFKKAILWQMYPIMDFILTAHWGIKGVVKSGSKNLPNAHLFFMNLEKGHKFAQKPSVARKSGLIQLF